MNEYLNLLLEQIRCKRARAFVREEIQGHLEEQIGENMQMGMDREAAEKAAVTDMGDPVEVGISLDRIHRPQIAWGMILFVCGISIAGILIHRLLAGRAMMQDAVTEISENYFCYVILGMAVMILLHLADYTRVARFSRIIGAALTALCVLAVLDGPGPGGISGYLGKIGIRVLILLYVPVYGGIIYKYRGSGYRGLLKALIWMVLPCVPVFRFPSVMTVIMMLVSMLLMLTIAVRKGWFQVRKKAVIAALWGVPSAISVIAVLAGYFGGLIFGYQLDRIRAFLGQESEYIYQINILRAAASGQFYNGNKIVLEKMDGWNSDYILAYLSASYGKLIGVILCCVSVILVILVFGIVFRQKNQLGQMIGCGCGILFAVSTLLNILINFGMFPTSMTFLPFFSAGGSCVVLSYALMGIVLSIYRYKSIYPAYTSLPSVKVDVQL